MAPAYEKKEGEWVITSKPVFCFYNNYSGLAVFRKCERKNVRYMIIIIKIKKITLVMLVFSFVPNYTDF